MMGGVLVDGCLAALAVEDAVELRAEQDAEGGEVEPDEGGDGGAQGAVDDGVVGDAGDVEAEGEGDGEPEQGGGDGAGGDAAPALFAAGAEMVDGAENGRAGEESEGPAGQPPKISTTTRSSCWEFSIIQCSMVWPKMSTKVAMESGTSEMGTSKSARMRTSNQLHCSGKLIGAAEALHKGEHDAERGEDGERYGGEQDLEREGTAGLEIGLEQRHGVGGEELFGGAAQGVEERCCRRDQGEHGGGDQEGREEHQHAGVGGGLGGIEDVVGDGLEDGSQEGLSQSGES